MSGFDGSGEELYYWIGPAAAERGWNCVLFEGPGQRGALHLNPGLTLRPDYEVPVAAVLDHVHPQEGVSSYRVVIPTIRPLSPGWVQAQVRAVLSQSL